MLADHVRVHRLRRDVQLAADDLPQPRRIEHRAGADDALGRQARRPRHDLREHVDRVGDDHDESAVAGESLADVAEEAGVLAQQLEAGFPRLATAAGGDHDRVGVPELVRRGRAHARRRIERGAVRQVHRFALGHLGARVREQQLVREARVKDRDGHAGAYPAGSEDADRELHA